MQVFMAIMYFLQLPCTFIVGEARHNEILNLNLNLTLEVKVNRTHTTPPPTPHLILGKIGIVSLI